MTPGGIPTPTGVSLKGAELFRCLRFNKSQHVGLLERWEVEDPNNWLFDVRRGPKFHSGRPVTAHGPYGRNDGV